VGNPELLAASRAISGIEAGLRAELPASGAWAIFYHAMSVAVWSAATETKDQSVSP